MVSNGIKFDVSPKRLLGKRKLPFCDDISWMENFNCSAFKYMKYKKNNFTTFHEPHIHRKGWLTLFVCLFIRWFAFNLCFA